MPNVTPILSDPKRKRVDIHAKAIEGVESLFPIIGDNFSLHLDSARVKPQEYSYKDYKDAILEGRSLSDPLHGNLILKNKKGKVIDESKDVKLLNIPHLTDHHTFIVDGNAYSVSNQLRTKPGVYTRIRKNEVPEVAFNLAQGSNFKVTMDPQTSKFNMEVGASNIPLYPVLRSLGVRPKDIEEKWGTQIHLSNSDISEKEYDTAVSKLYEKIIPNRLKSETDSLGEKAQKIKSYFSNTVLDPKVTEKTLGRRYSSVSHNTILDATDKLLRVFKNADEHDDRDSLEFSTLHSADDFIKERLQKNSREIIGKIQSKLDDAHVSKIKDVFNATILSKPVKSLITQFSLSRTPDQINPLEIMDSASKVTRLGEGGISSIRAVPDDTRDLHHTHVGVIDPNRTPESSSIGVDIRLALATAKDKNGNIFTLMRDSKTGKTKYVNVSEFAGKHIGLPKNTKGKKVEALHDGEIVETTHDKLDYEVPESQFLFSPATSVVPFVNNMQGNRALMGAKLISQALPLKERESPLVQVSAPRGSGFNSMIDMLGHEMIKTAPEDGHITHVTDDYIFFKGKSGEVHKLPYHKDFPLNSKTYIDETVTVPTKQDVKRGTPLTESNVTRDGGLALGRNARVGYMAYHGENSNDAVVVSEDAAKKFTSLHMHKKIFEADDNTHLNKKFWLTQFPNKFEASQLREMDKDGLPKVGQVIKYGDPIVLATQKSELGKTDLILGRIHRNLANKYKDASLTWDKEHPGVVTDVVRNGNRVAVTVKMEAPLVVGDKVSGSYGNKSIVSRIIPNDQMPRGEDGEPLEILIAPTSVVSRINPSQLLETALGKVAKKTGKKIIINNFEDFDSLDAVKKILKKHNIKDKEEVYDPVSGKKIPGIFTGYQSFYKIFKSTDTNFGARSTGAYDTNEQPVRGGDSGAKRIGTMELNALLAHGAHGIIEETHGLKSQKNHDWWNAYRLGLPLPPVKRSFMVDKFDSMLKASGIKVEHDKGRVQLGAMSDKEIKEISSGVISEPETLRKKDLRPELGGLFDPIRTGGIEGEKWSHLELHEPIVKPVFEKPAASILKKTPTELRSLAQEHGGEHIEKLLKAVDLDDLKKETREEIKRSNGAKLDSAVKRLKYIQGLEKMDLLPHEAYMAKKVLVLPPKMRPVVPGPNNELLVSDANHLYRDIMLSNKKLEEMKSHGFAGQDIAPLRQDLSNAVSALSGLSEPVSKKLQQQGKKGFIKQISGPRPSEGMFQERVLGRPQDFSGRGTIAPDPNLGMHEIGLPEDQAWGMYEPFVIKRLVGMGYSATQAATETKKKSSLAQRALETEVKDRPVIFNRAPSLHRFSVLAAYPKLVPGKTIRLNPYAELPLAGDYDGDSLQLHVPVSVRAINDAKKMTLDHLLFSDKTRNDLLAKPEMDAVIGLYESSRKSHSGKKFKFKNKEEAMAAYHSGKLSANDEVEIG